MTTIIPEDIISTNILRRLPSKSIGQFRCVSKRWLTLLTDPHFIQTHQKTLNTNRFIFESSSQPPKTTTICSVPYNNNHEEAVPKTLIDLPFALDNLYIYGSVNGLLFAAGYKKLHNNEFTYFVLNPTTKDYVEFPSSLYKQFFGLKGFGYDSVSGDYKVVVLSRDEDYDRHVYLYNVTKNTMKLVMSRSPYHHFHLYMLPGVFANGFLHWILYIRSTQEQLVIVAVSLADGKLTELPAPPSEEVDLSDIDTKLVLLGDKLAIFHQVKGDIWVMNDYGVEKSWTKIVVNGFDQNLFYKDCKPIVFYDNGKLLFVTGHRLWIYDVEEEDEEEGGGFTQIVDISYMKFKYFVGAYAETLVSPKVSTSK